MGSGHSKPGKRRPARGATISGPTDAILHVPTPRLDYRGQPQRIEDYELDRTTLLAALTTMANFIDGQGQNITIITVGGAVNTLLLKNRQSTHDVDFLGTNLNNEQRRLLDAAAKYAERHSSTALGGEWFNNQTMLWLPPDVHRQVTSEALKQNEPVFQKRGLKVLAAPWHYAMCGKMNRLFRPGEARPYDLTDAVAYLRYHIQKHGGKAVKAAQVKQWCRAYHKDTNDQIIRSVNAEYKRRYGRDGIVR